VVLLVPFPTAPLPVAQFTGVLFGLQLDPTNARNQGVPEKSVSVIMNAKAVLLVTLMVWNVVLLLSMTEVLLTVICAVPLTATSSPANKMRIVRFNTECASIGNLGD
jgi:hypothetical protein